MSIASELVKDKQLRNAIKWFTIGLIVLVAYIIFKSKIKNLISSFKSNLDYEQQIAKGGGLTNDDTSVYANYALTLYNAANRWYSFRSDDISAILNVFMQLKTNSDFAELERQWVVLNKTSKTISEFLRKRLTTSNIEKINVILENSAITKRI